MSQSASTPKSAEKQFFDLHTRGVGYLNRLRWVTAKGRAGRRGDSFLACAINALHGDADDPSVSLFDCRVSGQDAKDIVLALMPAVTARKKVVVAFVIGDIYAHIYERKVKVCDASNQWRETGDTETTALIKGRLLRITHVKIDGNVVYSINNDGLVNTTLALPVDSPDDEASAGNHRTGTNG